MAMIEACALRRKFGQITEVENLSLEVAEGEVLGLAIAVIDILVLRVAVGLFQREAIVVKWR